MGQNVWPPFEFTVDKTFDFVIMVTVALITSQGLESCFCFKKQQ